MAGRDQKKKKTRSDSATPGRASKRGTAGKGNRAAKRYANVKPRAQGAPGVGTLGLGLEGSAGQRTGVGSLDLGLEGSAEKGGVGTLGLSLEEARRRGVGDLDLELEGAEGETGSLGLDLE
jgi:hypothetical protein